MEIANLKMGKVGVKVGMHTQTQTQPAIVWQVREFVGKNALK